MNKPVITTVLGDRGGVIGSTMPQTLFVNGGMVDAAGVLQGPFGQDLILVFEGPMPTQVLRRPTIQDNGAQGVIVTVDVPVPTQGSPSVNPGKVWAVSGGVVSDEFDFPVGKG